MWDFDSMIETFRDSGRMLLEGKYGIEKEAQRVYSDGNLALTKHPEIFGDKLSNSKITVDFAESHIEMITPPLPTVEDVIEQIEKIQTEVELGINNEYLWPMSMPPALPDEPDIPIAKFGDTPEGKEKEIYRLGLAVRYGKKMQMISGIHYNFSFGGELIKKLHLLYGNGLSEREFKDRLYLGVTRNYLRNRWILIYLFGASPNVHESYDSVINDEMGNVKKCCSGCCSEFNGYKENAVSLRVSRFGYTDNINGIDTVFFNSLDEYIQKVKKLMTKKSLKYSEIGICKNGKRIQLNENILQKESEFYSSIRLKRALKKGESQIEALSEKGIEYLEVRILDVNPLEKAGVTLNQLYFMQVFMLYCLFEESPMLTAEEFEAAAKNHHLTALSGRGKRFKLKDELGKNVPLDIYSAKIFEKLRKIAGLIETEKNGYVDAIAGEYSKITDKKLLPSEIIFNKMGKTGFLNTGIELAKIHKEE